MFRPLAAGFAFSPLAPRPPGSGAPNAFAQPLLASMARGDKATGSGGPASRKTAAPRAAAKGTGRADAVSRLLQTLVQANARLTRDAQRSEQEARDANEARRRQAAFLVMIAHELRNPLLPLRLAARSLERAHRDATQTDALLATINSQVDHIGRLISDLLDSTAADAGRLRLQQIPVDLGDVLETARVVCQPALDARQHRLTGSCPPGTIALEGDPVRLVQVFVNLLENAAKYTPEGGRVSMRCELRGDNAVVTIADNGVGISAAALPHLFDLYAQEETGRGGLGIGLALVKQLVTAHGGTVVARSPGKGKGSEFVVTLPCRD